MPSVSASQRRFMGMVHATQKGDIKAPSKEVAEVAKEMKPSAAKDFAKTKEEGLPEHVKESYVKGFSKRASAHGLNGSQTLELLKISADLRMPDQNQIEHLMQDPMTRRALLASMGAGATMGSVVPGAAAGGLAGGMIGNYLGKNDDKEKDHSTLGATLGAGAGIPLGALLSALATGSVARQGIRANEALAELH